MLAWGGEEAIGTRQRTRARVGFGELDKPVSGSCLANGNELTALQREIAVCGDVLEPGAGSDMVGVRASIVWI
jgi:hypothetical protein